MYKYSELQKTGYEGGGGGIFFENKKIKDFHFKK